MRNHRPHHRSLVHALLLATAVLACRVPSARAQSDPRLGTVYYQVLYVDKHLSDLPNIPDTNTGIQSVLRIATLPTDVSSRPRVKVLSTKRPLMRKSTPDQTFRTHLTWNGSAWVGSASGRMQKITKTLTTKDLQRRANRKHRPGRGHPLLGSLRELQNQSMFWKLAAIDLEADMFRHAGRPLAGDKRWDLAAVGAIQRDVDLSIEQHQKILKKLDEQGKLGENFQLPENRQVKPLGPSGKVIAAKLDPKWRTAAGIAKPFNEVHILPHCLQIWATKTQTGRRTYHVSIAHAEAGTFGAFYYIAYADLSGDGLPDTPIARSVLARAKRPGQWTSWSFTTVAKRVFVGHAWPGPDTAIYSRRAVGHEWRNLSREVYTTPVLGVPPNIPYGPYVSNLRVYSVLAPVKKPTTQPTTKPAT